MNKQGFPRSLDVGGIALSPSTFLYSEFTIMKLTKTIVLKLREGEGEGEGDLEDTINAFTEGMNYASEIVYRHNKPISSVFTSETILPLSQG